MNPVLLKPYAATGSQVVLNGKVWKNLRAADYFDQTSFFRDQALAAYHRLSERFDYIVIEGAGSVAELNLRARDFVNLSMASAANANALLVADIDRGGVFASLIGTLQLLAPEERRLVRSFAVNRFRGDLSLFRDGVTILEERSGSPCLGVFPMLAGCAIQEEDSVSLDDAVSDPDAPIAIVRLPRISNFTDFRLLRAAWISRPVERAFEWVILPGTKSTIGDLEWLRSTGLDSWLRRQQACGARILGICGGYQMLGLTIADPHQVESEGPTRTDGLGLLPVHTVLETAKVVRAVRAQSMGVDYGAYEIHAGRTTLASPVEPFALIDGNREDGAVSGSVMGTYLHGALENRDLAAAIFGAGAIREASDAPYDRLADWFEQYTDMRLFEECYL